MSTPSLLHTLQQANDIRRALVNLEALSVPVLDVKEALVSCPGEHLHTTPNGIRDCKVLNHPDGPYLKCFHSSCHEEIARVNHLLRGSQVQVGTSFSSGNTTPLTPASTPKVNHGLIAQTIKALPWSYRDIETSSPLPLRQLPIHYHAPALLTLFDKHDIVWLGRTTKETGSPGHHWRFRPVWEWMARNQGLGEYICPNTFHAGAYSRSNSNIKDRRFLVVESDILNRDQVGSIFQWMIAQGHSLRAVVDTAGKSLHGWFEFPGANALPQLKRDLTALGCDPAMFGASQPCRLPGALRSNTKQYQKIIHLNA